MNRPARDTLFGFALCLTLAFGYCCKVNAQGRAVYGAGTVSCGEWQKYRLSNDKSSTYQLQAWVDGYLSGYNVAFEGVDILLGKSNVIAFYAWIDNYCSAHPLDELVTATTTLHKELTDRAKPKH